MDQLLNLELALLDFSNWGDLALRLVLAAIFLVHAKPKLLAPAGMAQGMGWPKAAVVILGIFELLGAVYVATGFLAQIGAAYMAIIMLGALYHKIFKWNLPFTAHDKNGWEFDLILLAAALMVMTGGVGAFVVA